MLNYYDHVRSHRELYKQFSCKEILFLLCECPPKFSSSTDWVDYNAFSYIISGKLIVHTGERSYLLQQGQSVFLKKGVYGIEKTNTDSFCSLLFYVPDSYLCSFFREQPTRFHDMHTAGAATASLLPIQTDAVLQAFFHSVYSYFESNTTPAEDLIELKLKELLLNIVTNPLNDQLRSYFYQMAFTNTNDLQEVMERNCLYNLQLHEFARLCHRSLSTFKRDFQAAYGMPPGRWLLEKRLEAAARLLVQSRQPVTDIAADSGFKHTAHFNRAFKEHFNLSPLQYRKQHTAPSLMLHD